MYFAQQAFTELLTLINTGDKAHAWMETVNDGAHHLLHIDPGLLNPADQRVRTDILLFSTLETGAMAEDKIDTVKLICQLLESPAIAPHGKIAEVLNMANRLLRYGCFYLGKDGQVLFETAITLTGGTDPLQGAQALYYAYSNSLFVMKTACVPIRRLCVGRLEPEEAGEMIEILLDSFSRL